MNTERAEEAIRSGFLAVRDNGLFGDDPQTWVYQPKPAAQHSSTRTSSRRRTARSLRSRELAPRR